MSKCHWEDPPHEYEDQRDRWKGRRVIVCDHDGCDWVGTAYASQFAVHELRRHD